MLIPLEQWICDTCAEVIESPEHGWLEWRQGEDHKAFEFRIVHHATRSPRRPHGDCYRSDERHGHLTQYGGDDGLVNLLCLLDQGIYIDPVHADQSYPDVKDIREWMELVRRLQIPYYEEARQYFHKASQEGYFDGAWGSIFRPESLKFIIQKYATVPESDP